MTKNLAIIGTGITGTAMLIALTSKLRVFKDSAGRLPQIRVITVEKRQLNGPGYPYDPNSSHSAHLLNHPATEMALKPVDEAGRDRQADFEVAGWHSHDFVRWLELHKEKLAKEYPESIRATHTDVSLNTWRPQPDGHYSRGLFGLYAHDRFREAVAELTSLGVEVTQYNKTQAAAIRRRGSRLLIALENLQTGRSTTIAADKVLVATGRWSKQIPGPLNTQRYFERPYPASSLLDAIRPRALQGRRPKRILVRGMGLSALDTILTFAAGTFHRDKQGILRYNPEGSHAQIIAVSRSGYFPIVRGMPSTPPELRHFTQEALAAIKERNDGYLTLSELKKLFEQELREHLGRDFDLAGYFLPKLTAKEKLRQDIKKAKQGNVVYAVCRRILALQVFSQLRPEDKEYFMKSLRTLFLQNVAAMPIINAEKILALFDAGILSTVSLGYAGTNVTAEHEKLVLTYDDSGSASSISADYIVQAAGDDLTITHNPDPFISSLVHQGEVIPDASGGIKVNFDTYAVLHKGHSGREEESESIYALGMPVMNWAAERDFASASTKAAYIVATNWVNDLERTSGL